jgi:hypothetical protein
VKIILFFYFLIHSPTGTLFYVKEKIPGYERFALHSRRSIVECETTRVPDQVKNLNAAAQEAVEFNIRQNERQNETMASNFRDLAKRSEATDKTVASLQTGQRETNQLLRELISLQKANSGAPPAGKFCLLFGNNEIGR